MIWLTGAALLLAVSMIVAFTALVLYNALGTFWPSPLVAVTTVDGRHLLGEVTREDRFVPSESSLDALPAAARSNLASLADDQGKVRRRLLRTGNFELTNEHFNWVSDHVVSKEELPEWAVIFERRSWGRFYGTPTAFQIDGKNVASDSPAAWALYQEHLPAILERFDRIESIKKHDIGRLNKREEDARLAITEARLNYGEGTSEMSAAQLHLQQVTDEAERERETYAAQIRELTEDNDRYALVVATTFVPQGAADGKPVSQTIPLAKIVRAYPANQLSFPQKAGVYFSRWSEFLFDSPREANTEGGVFPAIWGTMVMTLIMSLAVVPFGVLAALYLREYAKAGPIVSAVRIAINNLAGVPSIVFGVFGLGFFCYIIGGFIDGGPKRVGITPWPSPLWFGVVGLLALFAVGAFLLSIYNLSVRKAEMTPLRKAIGWTSIALWIAASITFVAVIAHLPHFDGFYQAKVADGNPTFGKGAMLWASFTLALLTLPVVIVATEEALAAVPNSMREGSYGCGASKWQTIRRIVLPRAMPGIMTGMILAMARGAGEVAPLMLVGAVKIAPELPVDFTDFGGELGPLPTGPVHLDRSFLHLGFQIYDVGFQSQNSEAAIPLVYTTTLLLIVLIVALNLGAVWLRGRLRRRFVGAQF